MTLSIDGQQLDARTEVFVDQKFDQAAFELDTMYASMTEVRVEALAQSCLGSDSSFQWIRLVKK